ncbi:uncharacterized protein LOC117331637 [Pecten maximus]|uniref:uncharacterized protein LOC117331637 n=1 Tax=Pecten maximus TaxID=6579 RepID=UPI0014583BB3|nr:uncharacterized protein LOC117331637 [Pecten maximus]
MCCDRLLYTLSLYMLVGVATTGTTPICAEDSVSYVTDAGCRNVWRCVGGRLSSKPVFTCGSNMVFSEVLSMCVWQGREHDDCSSSTVTSDKPPVPTDHTEHTMCVAGSAAAPHESECHLFYDCSNQSTSNDTKVQPGIIIRECEYPKLFSGITKMCENFLDVHCGSRREPIDKCDYLGSSECNSSEVCPPCAMRYPSCKDQTNGPHADVITSDPSSYLVCFKDRLVARGNCENDRFGEKMVFYENGGLGTSGSCWSVHDIPQNDGGLLPTCSKGVFFKMFPDAGGACNRFYECVYGMAFVRRCPGNLVYDSRLSVCSSREYVCFPCGSRICV